MPSADRERAATAGVSITVRLKAAVAKVPLPITTVNYEPLPIVFYSHFRYQAAKLGQSACGNREHPSQMRTWHSSDALFQGKSWRTSTKPSKGQFPNALERAADLRWIIPQGKSRLALPSPTPNQLENAFNGAYAPSMPRTRRNAGVKQRAFVGVVEISLNMATLRASRRRYNWTLTGQAFQISLQ